MKTKAEIEKLAQNYCEKLTGLDYKNVAFLAYYHGYLACQEQNNDDEPFGYYFNGRFYNSIDELKGRTMSDENKPVALFTKKEKI